MTTLVNYPLYYHNGRPYMAIHVDSPLTGDDSSSYQCETRDRHSQADQDCWGVVLLVQSLFQVSVSVQRLWGRCGAACAIS